MTMQNITVTRYPNPKEVGWAGYIQPQDHSWIAFIDRDGHPLFFLNRDQTTGAILSDDPAERQRDTRDLSGLYTGTVVPTGLDGGIATPVGMVIQPLGEGRVGD
jgi:hypothetical protein